MKIRILSILLLLVLLLTACQSAYNDSSALSPKVQKEIEDAFLEKGIEPYQGMSYVWDGDDQTVAYIGSYDGWMVIVNDFRLTLAVDLPQYIGKYYFGIGGSKIPPLYAYKTGELLDLNEAYDLGYISDDSMEKISKYFLENYRSSQTNTVPQS